MMSIVVEVVVARDVPIIIPVMRIIMVTITVILKENGVALIKKTDIKIIVK